MVHYEIWDQCIVGFVQQSQMNKKKFDIWDTCCLPKIETMLRNWASTSQMLAASDWYWPSNTNEKKNMLAILWDADWALVWPFNNVVCVHVTPTNTFGMGPWLAYRFPVTPHPRISFPGTPRRVLPTAYKTNWAGVCVCCLRLFHFGKKLLKLCWWFAFSFLL